MSPALNIVEHHPPGHLSLAEAGNCCTNHLLIMTPIYEAVKLRGQPSAISFSFLILNVDTADRCCH